MFTGPLVPHSVLHALRRGETTPEMECRFWTRPDNQVTLQYFHPSVDVEYQPHSHSEYTIVVCLAGAVTKSQLGRTVTIGPGEMMLGNFGVEHASGYARDGRGCEALCLSLDRRLVDRLLEAARLPLPTDDKSPVFLGRLASPVIHTCALEMVQELQRCELGQAIVLESLALRMLVETLRAWPRTQVEHCAVDWTPRLPRAEFVRAYEFMRWCRKEDFRMEHLCEYLSSSEERFTRLFRAATSLAPAQFYNEMLLDRGRTLLEEPELSIKQVGNALGFKTSSHFIAAFRREFGTTPLEYRRRLAEP